MATGIVKFFNYDRGYGFIEPTDGGPDIFVHVTSVASSGLPALTEGQKLNYEVKVDERSGKSTAVDLRNA